ncbi:hypothetical protein F5Y03DRAFT_187355 [Xylaria venustula]|nr:hypothetical protein F5Y03DRAFT_187355 [Xylaria venustula]
MSRQPDNRHAGNPMDYSSSPSFKFSDREFEDGLGSPLITRRGQSSASSSQASLESIDRHPEVYRSDHAVSKPIPIPNAKERQRPIWKKNGRLYFSGAEAPRTARSIEDLADEVHYRNRSERRAREHEAQEEARARREAEYDAVESRSYNSTTTDESSSSRGKSVAPRQDSRVSTPPKQEQKKRQSEWSGCGSSYGSSFNSRSG